MFLFQHHVAILHLSGLHTTRKFLNLPTATGFQQNRSMKILFKYLLHIEKTTSLQSILVQFMERIGIGGKGGSCFSGDETYQEGVWGILPFPVTICLSMQKRWILESGIISVILTAQHCNICTCIRMGCRCSLLTSQIPRRVPWYLILLTMSSLGGTSEAS